jgi:hypothetical protein
MDFEKWFDELWGESGVAVRDMTIKALLRYAYVCGYNKALHNLKETEEK